MPTIHIQNLNLKFKDKTILAGVNFCVRASKWTALLGASGVGKTSLLRLIADLSHEARITGSVYADNHLPLKQQIAYMAQQDLLLPWLSVLNNCLLGLRLRKHTRLQYLTTKSKAENLLQSVGLQDFMHHYPQQLSGGMRQRVALVRTFLTDKPIILMDEPFSALDTLTRYKLHEVAVQLLQDKTVLFITHDPLEALRLANEIYVLRGEPARAYHVKTLSTPAPRALNDAELLQLQNELLTTLLHTGTA